MSARLPMLAVTAGQVVPIEIVDLFEIVFVETEALVAREAPERRLVRIDQVRRVNNPILFQQPRAMVV